MPDPHGGEDALVRPARETAPSGVDDAPGPALAPERPTWRRALPFLPILAALLVIYVPDAGRGFVKDDFAWIAHSRVRSLADLASLFARSDGFYRPVVALSFAANEWLCGIAPRCYGLANLGLVLLIAGEIFLLAKALGLSSGPAATAASLWALNWHGIAMAVLWISGRTALVLLVFALAAALAVVRGWRVAASLACLLALLSKEEAVLLPAILLLWAAVPAGEPMRLDARRALRWVLPLGLPLVAYFALRSGTTAYLPSNAPHFYRPTLEPARLGRNVLEYADRAATMALVATLAACAVARRWPAALTAAERRVVALGAAWCLGGYGLTVFLPVRSSLYAVFPSVGVALAAAAACAAVWRRGGSNARRVLAVGSGVVALALVPVHWARNVRWVGAADLSAAVVARVQAAAASAPAGATLLVRDDPAGRYTAAHAFGTLIEDAARLVTGGRIQDAWIEPPPADWRLAGLEPPVPGAPAVCVELAGRTVRDCAPAGR